MRAVFLDFATLGPGDVDPTPLREVLPDIVLHADTPPAQQRQRMRGANIVFANKIRITAADMDAAPQLRLIGLIATGTDNIDLRAARERGIAVCNIRDYCTQSVAQHAIALMLALTHQLSGYQQRVRAGAWQASGRFCLFDYPIRELCGLNFAVIGYGVLGQATARLAEAIGMRILVCARPGDTRPAPADRMAFAEVLRQADVISLHCPLTEHNRQLIDADALAAMKHDALLINTARGDLVDADALAAALRAGRIGGAGIDVLTTEPPRADDPLVGLDLHNLIVTPHVAWSARQARQRAIAEVAANVRAFLAGKQRNRVV